MLILTASDVRKALPMDASIEAIKRAYAALSGGKAEMPVRSQLRVPPHDGTSLIMPAFVDAAGGEAMAIKIVSVFPKNPTIGLPLIHAAVLVLEAETGEPIALLEGGALTAIRTGAASGAATDLLARQNSKTAAIFGAGTQGRTQLEAICTTRSIETVWVYDLDCELVEAFIDEIAGQGPIPTDLRAAPSAQDAITDADIICTATTSKRPVFPDDALKPGVHINGVGSYTLDMIEVPLETAGRATVFIDSQEAAMQEAGELVAAINKKLLSTTDLTELGDVINGNAPGRTSEEEITFFKSVGVAVQDAMVAQLALMNAKEMGLGQKVDW
ncbi:MAG: hypothetical protein U9Q82_08745 [Chloroflexota bacterium]|nr:hypothetical protein [Chloroflexota bacterium]